MKKKVSASKAKDKRSIYHQCDCSKEGLQVSVDDINIDELKELIKDCFVTGKWSASEDAQQLLDEDGRRQKAFFVVLRSFYLVFLNHFLKFHLTKSQQNRTYLKILG